jgi:hypothetical protein
MSQVCVSEWPAGVIAILCLPAIAGSNNGHDIDSFLAGLCAGE